MTFTKHASTSADIIHLSYYKGEDEVLIMLGAMFHTEKINYGKKEQMWIASVSLASDDDYDLKDLFSHYKDKIGEETNINSSGKILLEMGEYDRAAKYYEQYLNNSRIATADSLYGLGSADLYNGNSPSPQREIQRKKCEQLYI
ncbi:unnamed protein product [Didymodactylos carnosus]|uniref:Uncharacterized protein n=1 Tax=Didymodactylos carnosus TaxID=1234261 RepID=A0A814LYJ8_9BILA|nr:unnamed protein product [Didymodactylos carnosus]CAF3838578.1 unnamed protein product [Didymodactylos carnosus]